MPVPKLHSLKMQAQWRLGLDSASICMLNKEVATSLRRGGHEIQLVGLGQPA